MFLDVPQRELLERRAAQADQLRFFGRLVERPPILKRPLRQVGFHLSFEVEPSLDRHGESDHRRRYNKQVDPELEAILGIVRSFPKPDTHPVSLSEEYLRLIAHVESLPKSQSGSDKTWVGNLIKAFDTHFRRAVRIR